jgi:hypothetical protein
MRVTDAALEVALPVLMENQRGREVPSLALEELLEVMLQAARRRRLDALLAHLERAALDAGRAP